MELLNNKDLSENEINCIRVRSDEKKMLEGLRDNATTLQQLMKMDREPAKELVKPEHPYHGYFVAQIECLLKPKDFKE